MDNQEIVLKKIEELQEEILFLENKQSIPVKMWYKYVGLIKDKLNQLNYEFKDDYIKRLISLTIELDNILTGLHNELSDYQKAYR